MTPVKYCTPDILSFLKHLFEISHLLDPNKIFITFVAILILLISTPVYASENFIVKSLSKDVYLLSSNNRWEKVYEDEKLPAGFRLKIDKDSSVTIGCKEIEIIIFQNSLFEVNDNFSQYTKVISSALFYGSVEFIVRTNDKKIRVVTPFNILTATKGRFRLKTDSLHRTLYELIEGKVFLVEELDETPLNKNGLIEVNNIPKGAASFSRIIISNIDILEELIDTFEQVTEQFESKIEKKMSVKKAKTTLSKEIDSTLSRLFNIHLQMSEAKNRINMFSHFLKNEIDEKSLSNDKEDEEGISDILESLKNRQDTIHRLKQEYNNITSSEMYKILKSYEISSNNKKKK